MIREPVARVRRWNQAPQRALPVPDDDVRGGEHEAVGVITTPEPRARDAAADAQVGAPMGRGLGMLATIASSVERESVGRC